MQRTGLTSLNQTLNRLGFTPEKLAEEKPKEKSYEYPFMDAEAIKETIQNAKKHINAYNDKQAEKSLGYRKINREFRQNIQTKPHTSAQKIAWLDYKKENAMDGGMDPRLYNTFVIRFNKKHNTNFLLREYAQLKNEMSITLSHLVFFYAAQIRDNNHRKLNAGVPTYGTLPRLRTNSESLRRFKMEGVRQCPYKNETLLKHMHNLVKAGVLESYKSHGRNHGFSVLFKPEILTVKDVKNQKKQVAENQSLKIDRKDKTPYSDYITRTVLNKYKNKADESTQRNEPSSTSVTGSTQEQNRVTPSVSNPDKNPKKFREKSNEKSTDLMVSQGLSKNLLDTWDLCKELAAGKYENHVPLPLKVLREEAQNGTLGQIEFREVIFQDFMKYISKLKCGDQSYPGAYYKAFEELDHKKLVNFAGRIYRKSTMIDEYEKWLWMVDHAERWGRKREWNFLYINDYLDTNRRDAKEVGFWYLEKIWKDNQRRKAAYAKEQADKKAEAAVRKKKIKSERIEKYGYQSVKPTRYTSDYDKARKAVRKYLYQEISFDELHRYCRHNLTKSIVEGLGRIITNEKNNLTKYQA